MKAYCVETAAIRYNLEKLTRLAGKTPIWAVLKGNGYGLGTGEMAKLCHEAGIRRFCVTEISEAMEIRMQFAQAEILMLRPTTDLGELQQMLDLDVIATISCSAEAAALNSLAGQRGTVAEVHVKVDTGMGRYGFMPHETEKILSVYLHNDNLAVSGIYTHFHSAFCNENSVFAQAETFKGVLNALIKAGVDPGTAHCCNSAAFLRWPELHMGGVRLGSALLGRVLVKADLRRVGRCETTVDEIRWLPTPRPLHRLRRRLEGQEAHPHGGDSRGLVPRLRRELRRRHLPHPRLHSRHAPGAQEYAPPQKALCAHQRKPVPGAGTRGHAPHGL